MNIPKFNSYACIGDAVSWTVEGYTLTATITEDDSTPYGLECYFEGDIQAWKNDEWFYCGIVISVEFNGVKLENNCASLWGIECNFPGADNSYLSKVAEDLEGEALECAKKVRQDMIMKLTGNTK